MLAYVFWHWPNSSVDPSEYERLQSAFHAALATATTPGFLGSTVFRVAGGAPWLPGDATPYADWYQLGTSAAIDALNETAVTGVCAQPHAAVAHAMAQGAGSLLALRGETATITDARHCTFLTKPRPTPYDAFYATVRTFATTENSLWRRALVLGPTPEFALLTPTPISAPADLHPLPLTLTPI